MKYLHSLSILIFALILTSCSSDGGKVSVIASDPANRQMAFAQRMLQSALDKNTVPDGDWIVELKESRYSPKEGFTISRADNRITITGNDGNGLIYGVDEFIDRSLQGDGQGCWTMTRSIADAPETAKRGCCFDFQPSENLPEWFYDHEQWIEYLNMMAGNRMNSLYMPSSVLTIDSTTQRNVKELIIFLTDEAESRGISLIKMDDNVVVGLHEANDTVYIAPQRMPYLRPWRWSSPLLINAALSQEQSTALNLSVLESNSDYPYTSDMLPEGQRMKQIERDWMWYQAWGRYAWRTASDVDAEQQYWCQQLAHHYNTTVENASLIYQALEESGRIAPALQRNFGVADDGRQTLLLGMLCAQLINPSRYANGMELNPEIGSLPLDVVEECVQHSLNAIEAVDAVSVRKIEKYKRAEFLRLRNDMYCYRDFAYAFMYKVQACRKILDYKGSRNMVCLEDALSLLNSSVGWWRGLVMFTRDNYLCASSQTSMRQIPVSEKEGNYRDWNDLLPIYEDEMLRLETNLQTIRNKGLKLDSVVQDTIVPARPFRVQLVGRYLRGYLTKGYSVFPDKPGCYIDAVAEEIKNLTTFIYDDVKSVKESHSIEFVTEYPVNLLVGYYRDNQDKYAPAPVFDTDSIDGLKKQVKIIHENDTTNIICNLVLRSAIRVKGMPLVDVYNYRFQPGYHKFTLPQGISLVVGFTYDTIKPRNVGLEGNSDMEWLFN